MMPNLQFATKAQCLVVAAGYPNSDPDANRAKSVNSLGCREYHAQASRADNNTHCEHAGPSGAGVCGSRAEAWASILAAPPCSDSHVSTLYLDGLGAAQADALILPVSATATGKYTTTFDTSGNTQACRIYHLGVASTTISHCSHGFVSGGDNCGTLTANLCDFIGGVCGWGTNASWQYATKAACTTALTNSTTNAILNGVPGTAGAAADSFECRFYHAMVAGSFKTGGKNAASAGAASMVQYHCSHTLKPTAAGGCGTAAPPKPSGAAALPVLGSVAVLFSLLAL